MVKIYNIFLFYYCAASTLFNGHILGYDTWTEYWQAYENAAYFPRLYPYSEEFHDSSSREIDGFDAQINFDVPYFGRLYKSAYVTMHGYVELSKDKSATSSKLAPRTKLPNEKFPVDPDPPLISVYAATWGASVNHPGNVFWRTLEPDQTTDEEEKEIIEGLLEVISQEVRRHVVGGDHFHAGKGLIVTWDQMTFSCCIAEICPVNTIQMALLVDNLERTTYVIYNYYNLTWIGGVMDSCDPLTGLRVDYYPYDNCFPAQAGFNFGEGRHFTELPGSNQDDVVDIDTKGATGIQGRYLYDVTHAIPIRGGCTNDTDLDPAIWPLEIYPQSIPMYGGMAVYFSGPCLLPDYVIQCKFGHTVVLGETLPETQSKGMCISPMMDRTGWVDLCVSTNDGNSFYYCTKIHTVPKYYMWSEVHLYNDQGEWYTKDPSELLMSWEPESLLHFHEVCHDQETCNITSPADMVIDILIIGYTEEPNENGTYQGIWHDLHTLETSFINTGEYSFKTAEHKCEVDCGWEKPHIGVIKITVSSGIGPSERSIYSEAFPLGWFLNDAMVSKHGDNWPETACIEWADRERIDTSWQSVPALCPMTRIQAYTDIGGFIYPPVDCEPGEPCPARPRPEPHIECAQSIPSSHNRYGSGSMCCYSPEGHLIYGQDHPIGSSSTRASPYVTRDSYDIKITPYLSHWLYDMQPYYLCCNWTHNNICVKQYMDVRATPTDHYKASSYGTGYGDPHFMTFDGNEYMFNGYGEFWLLKVVDENIEQYDNFNLHIRLQQPPEQSGYPVNATVITAVAMQEGPSNDQEVSKIQVELNGPSALSRLMVLVNGATKEFNTPGLMYQEIYSPNNGRRTIIQNNDHPELNHQSNFTIIFENGITIQTAYKNGFLHLTVLIPIKYYGVTRGLLGVWNGNSDDDLTRPDGTVISTEESTENIHFNFGMEWQTTAKDSRFTYRGLADWFYHNNYPDFMPNFVEPQSPNANITDEEVDAFCGENFVCRFDFKTTLSKEVANTSMNLQTWTHQLQAFSASVMACAYLDVPHSYRNIDSYEVGGHLVFTGCEDGYTLQGNNEYDCIQINEQEANWNPSPDIECKSNEEIKKEQQKLAAAIAVPICFVLVVVAVTTGFIYYRHKHVPQTNNIKKGTNSQGQTNRSQQLEEMASNASRSQSLASESMNVSFGSVVLSEELHTARPPRPKSVNKRDAQAATQQSLTSCEQVVLPQIDTHQSSVYASRQSLNNLASPSLRSGLPLYGSAQNIIQSNDSRTELKQVQRHNHVTSGQVNRSFEE